MCMFARESEAIDDAMFCVDAMQILRVCLQEKVLIETRRWFTLESH